MAELTALHTLTAQMKCEGIRRLLVLSGEERWCFDHALKLRDALRRLAVDFAAARC